MLKYEWNSAKAEAGGSHYPDPYQMQKIYDDLFASGFTNHYLGRVNMAVKFYPILMYTLARCLQAQYILEVGLYQGFTSFYLAKAAAIAGGHYYGIDIEDKMCKFVDQFLTEKDLAHTIINANSKEIKKEEFQILLGFPKIDFAFLDGEHNEEALLHEVELIYPYLPPQTGMICLHDVFCICDGALATLEEDKRFETLALPHNNGLALVRRIEGVETTKQRAARGSLKKLGCQPGESVEHMEGRHAKGDFYTDHVNSPEHDAQMRKEHPEMASFPEFNTAKERAKRYPA